MGVRRLAHLLTGPPLSLGLLLGWCGLPPSQWGRGRRGWPHPAVFTVCFFLKHFNIH